jgi:DNA-3-methyladenine glycosylase II
MIKELTMESIEVKTICENDPQMARLITLIGNVPINSRADRFGGLVQSIIGQLLSIKAANTISRRLMSLLRDEITPQSLARVSDEELRGVGISGRKISYIRDLCEKILTRELDLDTLDTLKDEEIIKTLMSVKGIGKWTAEMFLIFSVGRLDVLSLDDISLQRACKWLFEVDKKTDGKILLAEKGALWRPYCSVASFYLWGAVNNGFVDHFQDLNEVKDNQ